MEWRVQHGSIAEAAVDAIVVNLFAGVTEPEGATGAVDAALGGAIRDLVGRGEFKGEAGRCVRIHTLGRLPAPLVIVVGLGKREEFDLERVRSAAGSAARAAREARCRHVASVVHGAGAGGLDPAAAAEATLAGTILALHRLPRYKRANPGEDEEEPFDLDSFTLIERDEGKLPAVAHGAGRGVILARATAIARDLAFEPSNLLPPRLFAQRAAELAASVGLEVEVLDEHALQAKGMGSLLGVAKGSAEPPRLVAMRYRGGGDGRLLALVGKGITFDTGGISIKPSAGMEEMKMDKSGAAAVVGAMWAIAQLRPAIDVIGLTPLTENMPSGTAQKPGDVVRAMNGKTIEVINTDAEGRLILADAVAFAVQLGATAIVDIATLTGAVSIALGDQAAAVIGNHQGLIDAVRASGEGQGERFWQLPTYPEYKEQYKSAVADMKNIGGRLAGTITGGMIIGEFVDDVPWAHLDIAGVSWHDKDLPYKPKGATGFGCRTMVALAEHLAARPELGGRR